MQWTKQLVAVQEQKTEEIKKQTESIKALGMVVNNDNFWSQFGLQDGLKETLVKGTFVKGTLVKRTLVKRTLVNETLVKGGFVKETLVKGTVNCDYRVST